MKVTYGFLPYLRRLGITPRRPHSFRVTNAAVLPMNTVGTYDMFIGQGKDFLVDSIVIDTYYGNVAYYDSFIGMEVLTAGYKCNNRDGAFSNPAAVGDGAFSPFVANVSQPSPFVLPWILNAGETLRFTVLCPFGVPLAGEIMIVVNGWLLESVGQPTPFIPYVWTLQDQADLAVGTLDQQDKALLSGYGDFLCTSVTSKEEWELANRDVLRNLLVENVDEGGRQIYDRQNWGRGVNLRNTNGNSEPALPVWWRIPQNSIVTSIIDNDSAAIVRRPQQCLFGFFANPAVFPNGVNEEGLT